MAAVNLLDICKWSFPPPLSPSSLDGCGVGRGTLSPPPPPPFFPVPLTLFLMGLSLFRRHPPSGDPFRCGGDFFFAGQFFPPAGLDGKGEETRKGKTLNDGLGPCP